MVKTIITLLNLDTIQLFQEFADFFVGTRDNARTGVENSVLDSVTIEFDVSPPERLVRILVRPVNETFPS